jgi:hypothetical protein
MNPMIDLPWLERINFILHPSSFILYKRGANGPAIQPL